MRVRLVLERATRPAAVVPLDFAGALAASFPDFWLVPPAFVTVVSLFGLQNADGVWVCTVSDWFLVRSSGFCYRGGLFWVTECG